MIIQGIDADQEFDWGKTSEDYANYRDIYPDELYKKLVDLGLCIKGQKVLDLGTGTGVLPRNMHRYGAKFAGTDLTESQIFQAKKLASAAKIDIVFKVASAEEVEFPQDSFDVITAFQCFFYFNHEVVIPKLARLLKPGGALLYFTWHGYLSKMKLH